MKNKNLFYILKSIVEDGDYKPIWKCEWELSCNNISNARSKAKKILYFLYINGFIQIYSCVWGDTSNEATLICDYQECLNIILNDKSYEPDDEKPIFYCVYFTNKGSDYYNNLFDLLIK